MVLHRSKSFTKLLLYYVKKPDGLLSLGDLHSGFLCVFRGLLAHFFVVQNNSHCLDESIHLSIRRRKDILATFKFRQL